MERKTHSSNGRLPAPVGGHGVLFKVLIGVLSASIVVVGAALGVHVLRLHSSTPPAEISETFVPTPTPPPQPVPSPTPTPEPTPEPTPVPVDIPIDFASLQAINSDIIAWVIVDGTDIDYAVLYDEDEFYLTHDYYGNYLFSGCIFIQHYNSDDFSDFNTVMYGHNMGDGTMFAQLHRFERESFFNEHDTIIVYTPTHRLTYRIFAAYKTDSDHQLSFDYSTEELRQAYIDRIFTHSYSNFDLDAPVSESSCILTLSTCIGDANYRYLVQGVMIAKEYGIYSGD